MPSLALEKFPEVLSSRQSTNKEKVLSQKQRNSVILLLVPTSEPAVKANQVLLRWETCSLKELSLTTLRTRLLRMQELK